MPRGIFAVPVLLLRATTAFRVQSSTSLMWAKQDARKQLKVIEQSDDVQKRDFKMPGFESLARVRWPELVGAGVHETVATEIMNKWAEGGIADGIRGARSSHAAKGIDVQKWIGGHYATRVTTFQSFLSSKAESKVAFDAFIQFVAAVGDLCNLGARVTQRKQTIGRDAFPLAGPDKVKDILKKSFGYGWSARRMLANDFARHSSGSNDDDLLSFAILDKDVDGKLSFVELYECLPETSKSMGDTAQLQKVEWQEVARVEVSDLAKRKFPSDLTNNIMSLLHGKSQSFSYSNWQELSEPLNEFLRRTRLPGYPEDRDKFVPKLVFSQIADRLLSRPENIQTSRTVRVQALENLIDDLKSGILRTTIETVNRWLNERAGMTNTNLLVHRPWYAQKMAENVVGWGSHTVELLGVRRQKGPISSHLMGGKRSVVNSTLSDVAIRMAVFIAHDADKDGRLTFSEAYEYLKANDRGIYDTDDIAHLFEQHQGVPWARDSSRIHDS